MRLRMRQPLRIRECLFPRTCTKRRRPYQFHPKHIPFQPFVNIGGGALDFAPNTGQYQWRTAGLLEMGFDLPTHSKHIGFRIAGRSLYYRAPNFNTAAISTREWRVTEEPSVSTYYRF